MTEEQKTAGHKPAVKLTALQSETLARGIVSQAREAETLTIKLLAENRALREGLDAALAFIEARRCDCEDCGPWSEEEHSKYEAARVRLNKAMTNIQQGV